MRFGGPQSYQVQGSLYQQAPKYQRYFGAAKKAAEVTTRPARDFSRGIVKAQPPYHYIPGTSVKVSNVSGSYTAGRQVNYVATATAKFAFRKAPRTGVELVKYVARTAARA